MRWIKFRQPLFNGKTFCGWHYWGFLSSQEFAAPTNKWVEGKASQQFTGLKDKNGREIYEGDVVEIPYQTDDIECIHRVVYWDEEGARFSTAQEQDCDDDDILAKGIKVIGNIYEHGDLLDGK